jgi:endonuclease/exonuclease/phosphatase family metal-dependent hydrolase
LRKLIAILLLIVNFTAAIALIFSSIAGYISPATFWPIALLGMSFPLLLAVNIGFVLLWMLFWKKEAAISILALLFSIWHIPKYLAFNEKVTPPNEVKKVRVMTYNVHLFRLYDSEEATCNEMLDFITRKEADIICFQEFFTIAKRLSETDVKKQLNDYPYSYISYTIEKNKRDAKFGVAIFSKYPIVKKKKVDFGEDTYNSTIYTDLKVGKDTIRVFCSHLESVKLKETDKPHNLGARIAKNNLSISNIKSIARKLRRAYIKRAYQVDTIKQIIERTTHPIIFCGDFNDLPNSYTYNTIKGNMNDAFTEVGHGFAATYKGLLPTMRIDFIFSDKRIVPYKYSSPRIKFSDHYPVIADFYMERKNDESDYSE